VRRDVDNAVQRDAQEQRDGGDVQERGGDTRSEPRRGVAT
jgi:hypothetical protein